MKNLIFIFTALISFQIFAQENDPVQTVDHVDLSRYTGTWFEVASIPQRFQKDCERNTKAEYSLTDTGDIKVINSCEKESGERKSVEGRAKIVDPETNSKLKVTFVNLFSWIYLFGGDYWILDLAEDYSYALIGHPEREYAWILSRSPSIDPVTLEGAMQNLRSQGYDLCEVLTSIQDQGFKERKPLCEVKQLQ